MSLTSFRRHRWVLAFAFAAAFLLWTDAPRRARIERVTAVGQETALPPPVRSDGWRQLILPEHLTTSFETITQTQQMLEQGRLRIRHVTSDNAPAGRPVHAASPYRWWLASVAALREAVVPQPWAQAVEWASLWADPLLHLLLLAGVGIFAARRFGEGAATVMVLTLATLYPLAAGFLPGVPEDFTLFLALTPWFLLPLLPRAMPAPGPATIPPKRAGHRAAPPPNPPVLDPAPVSAASYAAAGAAAGVGLWINVTLMVPLLLGIALGAVLAAIRQRTAASVTASPYVWRWWGMGGAIVVVVAYLLEYWPDHLNAWELRAVHPLYGLGWLGLAEVTSRLVAWLRRTPTPRGWVHPVLGLLGLAAAAAVPWMMWRTGNLGFLNADLLSFRLTKEHDAVMAPHLLEWLRHPRSLLALLATLLPVACWLTAAVMAVRRSASSDTQAALALVLGPASIALFLGALHLRWWQLSGALLVVLIPVALAHVRRGGPLVLRFAWSGALGVSLLLGALQLLPRRGDATVLSLPEVEALVERDLAQTLARRLGPDRPVNLLAPPSVTSALHYYGGLPGLASLSWENKDGLSVALRIVISTSREEAHALIQSREVTHIILPSWDPFFETYTRAASVQASELFLVSLNRWVVPMWLRPIPYVFPTIGGFENQSVAVFEVVEEQDPPVAMSRMTEYFIEMRQIAAARAAGEALQRYPADFSALVARAQLEAALGDSAALAASLDQIRQRLTARGDRTLPWDRRVSLAVLLARARQMELARAQAERCLRQLNEERLRALTTYSVFHFLVLLKSLDLSIEEPALNALALDLLPADLRQQL